MSVPHFVNRTLITPETFVVELCHTILSTRVVTDSSELFHMTQPHSLEVWRLRHRRDDTICKSVEAKKWLASPLYIDIHFVSLTGTKILLEEWSLQCSAGVTGGTVGPRASMLRGALLQRCIASFLRTLPAHRVSARVIRQRGRQITFTISDTEASMSPDHVKRASFPPADLMFGRVDVSVRYLITIPEEALKSAPDGPVVISDYVRGEPANTETDTRNFFSADVPIPNVIPPPSTSLRGGSLASSSLASSITASPPIAQYSLPGSIDRHANLPFSPFVQSSQPIQRSGGVLPFQVADKASASTRHVPLMPTRTQATEPWFSAVFSAVDDEPEDIEEEVGSFIKFCETEGARTFALNNSSITELAERLSTLQQAFAANLGDER
eukprot:PhM_4_TR8066/c0_g1_i2/m.80416